MEHKQDNAPIKLDNFNDYLHSLDNELINTYSQHIQFTKRSLERIEKFAYRYDLPLFEYEKALRLIQQYKGLYNKCLRQEIGEYAVNPNKFDSIKAMFDERNEGLINAKNTLKDCKQIIKDTIKRIKKQEALSEPKEKQGFFECGPNQSLSMGEEGKQEKKLLMREIALIYWYDRDNLIFSKSAAQQIAEQYKHTSKTSGQSLYQDHYLPVSNDKKQRTHNDTSVQYLNNIIPRLTTDRGKREANEDLEEAKDLQEKKKNKLF